MMSIRSLLAFALLIGSFSTVAANQPKQEQRGKKADTTVLTKWQAGRTTDAETVEAFGAIDINTLYNPYYKVRSDGTLFIQPATAKPYCNRDGDFPYKIDHDDLCFRLFTEAGFEWGGDWKTCKDYQHFEWIE